MRRSRIPTQHGAVVRTRRLCPQPRPAFVTLLVASPARLRQSRRRRRRASAERERVVVPTERRRPLCRRADRAVDTRTRTRRDVCAVRRVTSPRLSRRIAGSAQSEPTPVKPAERAPSRERVVVPTERRRPLRRRADRAADTRTRTRRVVCAVCRRTRRAPSWPHRRAPTDAILTLSFVAAPPSHPAPAHTSQHDDGERAPSREHVVLSARRRPRRAHADRVVVLGVRRPGRTAERRPTPSSRSASLLLLHRTPRRLTRANTTTVSERRAASTPFF